MRILLFVLCLGLPHIVVAACGGTDQRLDFTTAQQTELDSRLSGMPFINGNHWLARKGARAIHVIGTVHIDDPRLDAITSRLGPVIVGADVALFEATDAEEKQLQSVMATQPDIAFINDGPSLLERMSEADWARVSNAAQARGIPPFMAAKFQPWLLSLTLGMPPCVMQQMQAGGHGLDHRLRNIAAENGIPQMALEPYDTIFQVFAEQPMEEQIRYLALSTLSVAQSEDAVFTLMEQYFAQEHGAVMEVSRITGRAAIDLPAVEFNAVFDEAMDGLLGARNQAWMSVIAQVEAETVVVAVGAAHLAGRDGLLNLLELAGYTLERQAF